MTIMNGLQCGSEISALWTNVDEYIAKCIYAFPFETGFAISNFILDLLIIMLPLPKVKPGIFRSLIFLMTLLLDLVLTYERESKGCCYWRIWTGFDVRTASADHVPALITVIIVVSRQAPRVWSST